MGSGTTYVSYENGIGGVAVDDSIKDFVWAKWEIGLPFSHLPRAEMAALRRDITRGYMTSMTGTRTLFGLLRDAFIKEYPRAKPARLGYLGRVDFSLYSLDCDLLKQHRDELCAAALMFDYDFTPHARVSIVDGCWYKLTVYGGSAASPQKARRLHRGNREPPPAVMTKFRTLVEPWFAEGMELRQPLLEYLDTLPTITWRGSK